MHRRPESMAFPHTMAGGETDAALVRLAHIADSAQAVKAPAGTIEIYPGTFTADRYR